MQMHQSQYLSQYLLVQSQWWKCQNNKSNLHKINNKETRTTVLMALLLTNYMQLLWNVQKVRFIMHWFWNQFLRLFVVTLNICNVKIKKFFEAACKISLKIAINSHFKPGLLSIFLFSFMYFALWLFSFFRTWIIFIHYKKRFTYFFMFYFLQKSSWPLICLLWARTSWRTKEIIQNQPTEAFC